MRTFIILFQLTDQGIRNIKDSPDRIKQTEQIFEKKGAHVKAFYLLMGQYDTIFVVEAPDEYIMTELCLELASLGNVRTQTMSAFDEEEFREIVNKI